MPFTQPIIDLGIFYATGRSPSAVGDDACQKLTAIFAEFIANQASPDHAATQVAQLGYDPKSIVRIAKILTAQPAPPDSEPKPAREAKQPGGTISQHRQRGSPWSAEEDERLLAGIYHFGLSDWHRVSQFVGNRRTRAQCGQRWLRCLDPNMKKEKWTTEEDAQLIRLVETYGEHAWAKIAKDLGSRTDVQCRYRYIHHIRGIPVNQNAKQPLVPPVGLTPSLSPMLPYGIRQSWVTDPLGAPPIPVSLVQTEPPVIPCVLDETGKEALDPPVAKTEDVHEAEQQ